VIGIDVIALRPEERAAIARDTETGYVSRFPQFGELCRSSGRKIVVPHRGSMGVVNGAEKVDPGLSDGPMAWSNPA
jgi:hypothetical protein